MDLHRPRNASSLFRRFTALLSLIPLSYAIIVYLQIFLFTTTSESLNKHDMPPNLFERSTGENNKSTLDEANYIVQRAYEETYARMAHCNDSEVEKDCIKIVVEHFNHQSLVAYNNASTLQPLPWWFQTLLRDIPLNGAYGFWHHFSTASTNTPIKFCAMAKNGSTEWRKVFKKLNAPEFGNIDNSKYNTRRTLGSGTPQTVFLRDPLERLLSAYLDKCVKDSVRKTQGHCEPNAIFAPDWIERRATKAGKDENPKDDKENMLFPQLAEVSQDSEKEKFAAFVDVFPLKWNVHFVPQAIVCDLYRNIDQYDVYFMGKSFMSELDRFSTNYGDPLSETLEYIFHYKSQLAIMDGEEGNVGANNKHGTKAPTKVARYYSPRAVRRALEYLSIDYVTLGLDVPDWAREMLNKDK